jgi:hypothetical protein
VEPSAGVVPGSVTHAPCTGIIRWRRWFGAIPALPQFLVERLARQGEQFPDPVAQAPGLMDDPRIELLLEVNRAAPARVVRLADLPAQTS